MAQINQNFIFPLDGYDPKIGSWLWALQDTRRRTWNALEGLDDKTTNWVGGEGEKSIASLLYHIAAVEMSWLYEDILERAAMPQIFSPSCSMMSAMIKAY